MQTGASNRYQQPAKGVNLAEVFKTHKAPEKVHAELLATGVDTWNKFRSDPCSSSPHCLQTLPNVDHHIHGPPMFKTLTESKYCDGK